MKTTRARAVFASEIRAISSSNAFSASPRRWRHFFFLFCSLACVDYTAALAVVESAKKESRLRSSKYAWAESERQNWLLFIWWITLMAVRKISYAYILVLLCVCRNLLRKLLSTKIDDNGNCKYVRTKGENSWTMFWYMIGPLVNVLGEEVYN